MQISKRQSWAIINRQTWLLFAVGLIVLTGFRLALYILQQPTDVNASLATVVNLFITGMRFDAKLMASLLIPNILLSFLLLPLPRYFISFYRRFWLCLGLVMLFFIFLLSFINHFFFSFYQSPINALIFGFLEDDTTAILATVWRDWPIVSLTILLLIISLLPILLVFYLTRKPPQKRPLWLSLATVFASFLALLIVARGSLGVFPLGKMDMAIAEHSFINNLVPSGAWALYEAATQRSKSQIKKDPLAGLHSLGFTNPQQAAQAIDKKQTASEILSTTSAATNSNKPHVVLNIMESFGSAVLDYDHPLDNDLLGELRQHLSYLDHFKRAIAFENGTHPTLEALLFDTPISPLTQGEFTYKKYQNSIAAIFKQAGYNTVFITAGSISWRNLQTALSLQGFDKLYGQASIKQRFVNTSSNVWGVDDEWMYKYAQQILAKSDKPIFMVLLSISNHPPYKIPKHYAPKKLQLNAMGDKLASSKQLALSLLQTYQYANNALGVFLTDLKQRQLLDKTIFAATGDHSSRSIFSYPDNKYLHKKYGVPILMHIPAAYTLGKAQLNDWVSHQDIITTLLDHALVGAKIPKVGRNMYLPAKAVDNYAFSFANSSIGGGKGVLISAAGSAVGMENPSYYHWNDKQQFFVSTDQPNQLLAEQTNKARALMALRDWRIRKQALEN